MSMEVNYVFNDFKNYTGYMHLFANGISFAEFCYKVYWWNHSRTERNQETDADRKKEVRKWKKGYL